MFLCLKSMLAVFKRSTRPDDGKQKREPMDEQDAFNIQDLDIANNNTTLPCDVWQLTFAIRVFVLPSCRRVSQQTLRRAR